MSTEHTHPESDAHGGGAGFSGPACWALTTAAGATIGAALAFAVPGVTPVGEVHPAVPLWLVAPFVLLLLSIAILPVVARSFFHRHYADIALSLGALVTTYYLLAMKGSGPHHSGAEHMLHAGIEYYGFLALVAGLFVVSGGILVNISGRGGPGVNLALLAVGAVLANVIGTTGASVVLIRPFMRLNRDRLRPIHIVFFIFIVSNCGGALTPIGDPPLYLGYLKGVPFFWSVVALWPSWLLVVGSLLAVFYVVDRRIGTPEAAPVRVQIHGLPCVIGLGLVILGVFIDPLLDKQFGIHGFPIGPTFQLIVAGVCYALARRDVLRANAFTFEPVLEVGLLFLGIFATMVPALGYLAAHGRSLGLDSPSSFYFLTGTLSAVLDNAPTYLNFLQVALGDQELNAAAIAGFLASPSGPALLGAISSAAVFFGAMTYIGNGPNFMVRSIAEAAGVKMPSFFGFAALACVILFPILVLHWVVFVR